MDLSLRRDLAAAYRSQSQVARVVLEHWAGRELYCPACPADRLEALPVGTRVSDFECGRCGARYQVKAKKGRYGASVSNSAYEAKMEAIRAGTVPNYVFLNYDPDAWRVTNGFVVPGHFITPSVISKRPPLGAQARRAGWVGSNILLGAMPPDARVALIADGSARSSAQVRTDWNRFRFLKDQRPESRGWIADVLAVIRSLDEHEFHLSDLYAKAPDLKELYPNNRHVEEKIRQQVQVLRDRGILRSLGRGRYEIPVHPRSMDL